ncbi:hypothetical protein ISO73_18775 [Morganella morganii subsp. morganii]|uniref:hypothetical protein n=1 Tax=Morganella morganii TaxID=582 RepID=UPI000B3FD578|nr:hypothetical protein [Morganella morganii]ELA7677986.1 hypothetical protein [Morganella morganii]MBT0452285.1 hypothetical protein [Morganella morganii subsp. morganii]MBT0506845.1 hypothetical protein [Morganella morganii subsp. morganii]MCW9738027.1 YdfR family protein [Morganella morganii]MDT5425822.1 hypothetical protein [Morganella morganii]
MKKLTVSIGSLGSAAAGDYVSFNIWQGKRLLVSDKIAGKHSGTFHREYDVDYTQGEPLRIESNTPAGCSVGVNVTPSDDVVADTDASAVFNGVLRIKDNQIFIRETFIDTAWLNGVTPNFTFVAHSITPDSDTVTAYVDVKDSMLPLMSIFSLQVTMERNDELSLGQYESAAIRQAKALIIAIAKEAAL